ncbi:hypothetical protein [Nostoc sp.]
MQLNLQNLFDILYYESATGGSTVGVNPGAPFEAQLSLGWEF